jgi:hypothetical protein
VDADNPGIAGLERLVRAVAKGTLAASFVDTRLSKTPQALLRCSVDAMVNYVEWDAPSSQSLRPTVDYVTSQRAAGKSPTGRVLPVAAGAVLPLDVAALKSAGNAMVPVASVAATATPTVVASDVKVITLVPSARSVPGLGDSMSGSLLRRTSVLPSLQMEPVPVHVMYGQHVLTVSRMTRSLLHDLFRLASELRKLVDAHGNVPLLPGKVCCSGGSSLLVVWLIRVLLCRFS